MPLVANCVFPPPKGQPISPNKFSKKINGLPDSIAQTSLRGLAIEIAFEICSSKSAGNFAIGRLVKMSAQTEKQLKTYQNQNRKT